MPTHRLKLARRALLLACSSACALSRLSLADTTWLGGTGDWYNPANWSAGLPNASQNAVIANNGVAQVSSDNAAVNNLYVAGDSVGNKIDSLALSGGTLAVTGSEIVATRSNLIGTINQTGGAHIIGSADTIQALILGYAASATAVYNLSGEASLTILGRASSATFSECVGYSGIATFNQTGGTHTNGIPLSPPNYAYGVMNIGYNTNSLGVYNLSGGTLNVGYAEWVGGSLQKGTGKFNQTGGTNTIIHDLVVSSPSLPFPVGFGNSTYVLSGNSMLSVGFNEYIAHDGSADFGSFYQSGGTNAVTGSLLLSFNGGSGAYTLVNGQVSAAGIYVGYSKTGSFIQSGGAVSAGSLDVAYNTGSIGNYDLSGTGNINVTSVTVGRGGQGTFNQSGGTLTTSTLAIARNSIATGVYNLSGSGVVNVTGSAYISGYAPVPTVGGAGILNIQGGSMYVANTLRVARVNTNTPLTLSGGVLSVGNLVRITYADVAISGSGYLDLNRGSLVFTSDNANPGDFDADYLTYKNYLLGNQIRSSSASSTTTLALMKGTDYLALHGPTASFAGVAIGTNDLLIKYTYTGDADLSGNIDLNDYSLLEAGFLLGNFDPNTNPASWVNGDFNNDGKIDMTDFALIDNAFLNQSGTLANDEIAQHATQFGTPYLTALQSLSTIPEPASLALLTLPSLLILRRRQMVPRA